MPACRAGGRAAATRTVKYEEHEYRANVRPPEIEPSAGSRCRSTESASNNPFPRRTSSLFPRSLRDEVHGLVDPVPPSASACADAAGARAPGRWQLAPTVTASMRAPNRRTGRMPGRCGAGASSFAAQGAGSQGRPSDPDESDHTAIPVLIRARSRRLRGSKLRFRFQCGVPRAAAAMPAPDAAGRRIWGAPGSSGGNEWHAEIHRHSMPIRSMTRR